MIFVKNLASVSNQEWSSTEKYPGVRWKFLIDSDFDSSSGLSLGFAEIEPGGNLTLHYHSPAEIYVVTNGTGILNKSGELETIKKGDVVYIAGNIEHALKNNGKETLEFYWIFPTDRFSEVEYFPSKQKSA
ncbi:cupin domain-containing protein [Candidatus Pelagibacter sp.]|jgi:mannose-6-phosphate isomerase-like protein (cupin superfamily)|nr:cupin domain-containing protein [Candidatus Pelagibacter sp.]